MTHPTTIFLQDGYNGHGALFFTTPLKTDGLLVKLQCAEPGKSHLIRWAHRNMLNDYVVCEQCDMAIQRGLGHLCAIGKHVATVLP